MHNGQKACWFRCGEGVLTKVLYREAPPRGLAPYLLYSIFDRNDSPFVYFPLTNGSTPLTYLGYNLLKIAVLSNKYITKRHVKPYKKQIKINFEELLAAYNCKAVSVLFKFAHPFLLLYLLCYPYRQFFVFFQMFWAVYFMFYSVWRWFPLFEFWLI